MYKSVIIKTLVILGLCSHSTLNALDKTSNKFKPLYSFINTSVNYLDWDNSTEGTTTQKDFAYLELEGGAGWTWGEFYGFIDIENPTKSYNNTPAYDLRIGAEAILDINLLGDLALHIQDYYLNSNTFYVSNLVTGFSYKYVSDFGLWIKPFIGAHYQDSTYYSGFNGYMAGWALNYDFKLFEQKVALFQWHEMEFNRDKEHYQLDNGMAIGDGKSHGINGALSAWWNINKKFTTGIQYRYAENKLGFESYQSAIIYSFKYNF